MAYEINWSGGKPAITLNAGIKDSTSTSLTLTGKGVKDYGEIQQENFIRLLENFASNTPPANPTHGQLWWNDEESILYVKLEEDDPLATYPRYFPDGSGTWAQVWPSSTIFAGIREYNALATRINRVLGSPIEYGGTTEDHQYGWGQTDLLPIFTSANTAYYPGSSAVARPFNNDAWTVLLARLRKALKHCNEAAVTVAGDALKYGYVQDGRGANSEAQGHETTSATPHHTFTDGWNGYGLATKTEDYALLKDAVTTLETSRFAAIITGHAATMSMSTSPTTTYTNAWPNTANTRVTLRHTIPVEFLTETAAKAFFNSGGFLSFHVTFDDYTATTINEQWETFLADINTKGIKFGYKGVVHNGAYHVPSSEGGTLAAESIGFYDLYGSDQEIFTKDRDSSISGAYGGAYSAYSTGPGVGIYGTSNLAGRMRVLARTDNSTGYFRVIFTIELIEEFGSGVEAAIVGRLDSNVSIYSASSLNLNNGLATPSITAPTATAPTPWAATTGPLG